MVGTILKQSYLCFFPPVLYFFEVRVARQFYERDNLL